MTYQLFHLPKAALSTGAALKASWKIYFYLTTTTTQAVVYTSSALDPGSVFTQPIQADSGGTLAAIYLDPSVVYKASVYDQNDVFQYTVDPVNDLLLSGAIIGALLYPISDAETAAVITPTDYTIPSDDVIGYVDPRRYGVDTTGVTNSQTAMNNTIAVLRKSVCKRLYIPGTIKVTDLNLSDAYAMSSAAAPDFNNGLTIFGDGKTQSKLVIVAASNNAGVGIHMVGVARCHISDVWIYAANGSSPKVLVLQSKGFQSSAVVFSGFFTYHNVKMTSYGSYTYYNQSSEQTEFIGTEIDAAGSASTSVVLSRANTAAITSIYAPLNSPGNSMTMVDFIGGANSISSAGVAAVLFDNGTTGIGTFNFGETYFPISGATTIVFKDTGGVGSQLIDVTLDNAQVEFNGGAGTNQVAVLTSASVENCAFHGYSAYSQTQTATLFSMSGPTIVGNRINWIVNSAHSPAAPAAPGYVIETSSAIVRCVFSVDSARDTIHINSGSSVASELICTDGTFFLGEVKCEGFATNAITYDLQRYPSGGSQTGNRDGGIRRQSTTGINNGAVTVIYNGASYAELAVVSGVDAGGGIWADLLMIAYNAFTVISSNTQQGGVAARTYSVNNNGTLRLTTSTATLNDVTVQTFRTGGYGA